MGRRSTLYLFPILKMKKLILLLPILFWIGLFVIEIISLFFQYPKPMYFRAWEFVINQGKDSYYVPFQPRIYYKGPMRGDLLLLTNFTAKKSEVRDQIFQADEYGFRNNIDTYKKNIKAVITGTSFVGGAQETQANLVSSILTEKYNIPTYNYATLPLQHLWEDERFIKKSPKFVIVLMNETEALQNSWVEVLIPSTTTHNVNYWESYEQWNREQNSFEISYENITKFTKRFSIIKYLLKETYLKFLNSLFSRKTIASNLIKLNIYDPEEDMLFWDSNSYNPLINQKAIKETIDTLSKTKSVLATRNIDLIVAVMPSKTTLYSKQYRNFNSEKLSITQLEKLLEIKKIDHINLFDIMKKQKEPVYYKEDGHWNSLANKIIAQELSKKIKELESKGNDENYETN